MNSFSHLNSLFIRLRKEYTTFTHLLLHINLPNTPHKQRIQLYTCRLIITKLFYLIQTELTAIKHRIHFQSELQSQISIKNSLNSNLSHYYSTLRNCLTTLTHNIPFYAHDPLSTQCFSSYKLSSKDIINFTNRISRQLSYPIDLQPYQIPSAFLDAYPREDQELMNSILKDDLSDEHRLLPPLVEPPGGQVKKGEQLRISYNHKNEKDIYDIFFKYTIDSQSIPSFFSGELYSEYHPIILEKDCTIKVCACKIGRKDSLICTYQYNVVLSKSGKNVEIVNTRHVNKNNVIERPEMEIAKNGIKFTGMHVNSEDVKASPFIDSGNASYHLSSYIKPQYSPRDDDDYI